ncbi:hypothetical protein ICN10_01675 [Polynucleobacter sp. 86C-FISCH]|uniref:DUF6036 family nucleotidyltransferase n=1 Tax=Polynucleobacter sp. 86C-FISCH TaxID=2689101 RepID=UPI001C0E636C|nr:DUF6036 family nucleotidyltransferase [Polynucleobacter sp. 86C-FISCH]MBU3595106.1 hypothetical protein [Polynucleobacter sp. 86C-FISCH]
MSNKPITLHTDTPLAQGVIALLHELETRLELSKPLGVFVAGGVAAHFYTASRSTYDVDAEFSSRILIPQDLAVEVDMGEQGVQTLFFDTNYNSTFALMHEDYLKDSVPLDTGLEFIKVNLLAPVDLAVSKISRLSDNDKQDIADLVRSGCTNAIAIEKRANEAVGGYIGNLKEVRQNIDSAVSIARQAEPKIYRAPKKGVDFGI